MKIYKVRAEHHSIETFTIRAENREAAKDEADNLVTGNNLSAFDSTILSEEEDIGQEADND